MSDVRSTHLRDARPNRRHSTVPKLQYRGHRSKHFYPASIAPVFAATAVTARRQRCASSRLGFGVAVVVIGIVLFVVFCIVMMKNYNEQDQRTREQIATEQRENDEAIKQHHALIGMTAAQVRQAWGERKRVIRTMDERHTYEEWIYGRNGSASLYFGDGVFKSGTRMDGK